MCSPHSRDSRGMAHHFWISEIASPPLWEDWVWPDKSPGNTIAPPPPRVKATPLSKLQRAYGPYYFGTQFNSVPNVVQPHNTWVW